MLWAANYPQITDLMSSKPQSECEGVWAVYKLRDLSDGSGSERAVILGVGFYGVVGDAIIKNANFPNLQRTKNER